VALPPLDANAIHLGSSAVDKHDAVEQAGRALLEVGAVEEAYVAAMHERETSVSTYIGEGVAIPHGTDESRVHVKRTALSFIQFPEGVDWGGATAKVAVGIASSGNEHVAVLSALARILTVPEQAEALRTATTPEAVLALLEPTDDEP
jgi:PTS system mannitol-specific IIA component/phosphocarrier protein FPr